MKCGDITGVYKRMKPYETSLFKLISDHFDELEATYDECFRGQYGFFGR